MAISPGQMTAIGRGIQNYNADIWEKEAPKIAAKCQLAKFTQNKELQDYLLATHDKELIEDVPVTTFGVLAFLCMTPWSWQMG